MIILIIHFLAVHYGFFVTIRVFFPDYCHYYILIGHIIDAAVTEYI
jgi:hypothetical protein